MEEILTIGLSFPDIEPEMEIFGDWHFKFLGVVMGIKHA
jgi:hypothetical protein